MPKNTFGGNGAKKAKNIVSNNRIQFKEDLEDYAIVTQLLGNNRIKIICLHDNSEKIGIIRGNMRKKIWISKDDIVLVSLREFQDNKCDIIYKYEPDDVKLLVKYGEINKSHITKEGNQTNYPENDIVFEDVEIDDI